MPGFKRKTRQEKMDEVMSRLNNGITEFFTSEKPESYKEYLKVMSQFYRYSAHNCALIAAQCPGATYVAGYKQWQEKFNRYVNKGENGLMILMPGKGVRDVETGEVDADGNKIIEKRKYTYFFPQYVFDISQTSGQELPTPLPRLDFEVKDYDRIMDALREMASIPVFIEEMNGTKSGFFSPADNTIHIKNGMSNAQTIKTFIHELTHSRLHNDIVQAISKTPRDWMEVEAESTAFIVCEHLGLDTSDYSFGYVAGWSDGKTLEELKSCAVHIKEASKQMILELDEKLGIVSEADEETEKDEEKIIGMAQTVLDDSPFIAEVTGVAVYGEKIIQSDEPEKLNILILNDSQSYTAQLSVTGARRDISDVLRSYQIDNGTDMEAYDVNENIAEGICTELRGKGMEGSLSSDIPVDTVFDIGFCTSMGNIYAYSEPMTKKSVSVVLSIKSEIDEGEIFKILNSSDLKLDGNNLELNTVMATPIDKWSENYIERLDKFENNGADARWPMVTIHATNIEQLTDKSMNIYEAVQSLKEVNDKVINDPIKYALVKISYVYNDWQYETIQNIDFSKGRLNFIDYLNLPEKTIRHLKAHSELIKMSRLASEFSPGTDYGAKYSDDMQAWSKYCRIEINHNSDKPVIPRPPEIDDKYIVVNRNWSLENGG